MTGAEREEQHVSEQTSTPEPEDLDPEEYGGLTVEDDPEGTVDPSELAGTAEEEDEGED